MAMMRIGRHASTAIAGGAALAFGCARILGVDDSDPTIAPGVDAGAGVDAGSDVAAAEASVIVDGCAAVHFPDALDRSDAAAGIEFTLAFHCLALGDDKTSTECWSPDAGAPPGFDLDESCPAVCAGPGRFSQGVHGPCCEDNGMPTIIQAMQLGLDTLYDAGGSDGGQLPSQSFASSHMTDDIVKGATTVVLRVRNLDPTLADDDGVEVDWFMVVKLDAKQVSWEGTDHRQASTRTVLEAGADGGGADIDRPRYTGKGFVRGGVLYARLDAAELVLPTAEMPLPLTNVELRAQPFHDGNRGWTLATGVIGATIRDVDLLASVPYFQVGNFFTGRLASLCPGDDGGIYGLAKKEFCGLVSLSTTTEPTAVCDGVAFGASFAGRHVWLDPGALDPGVVSSCGDAAIGGDRCGDGGQP
jgi:hypothetical protein